MASIEETFEALKPLIGEWKGRGEGDYPTIEPFLYQETLTFEADTGRPILLYEQKADVVDTDGRFVRNSHWETGFLLVEEDGSVLVKNAQTGRVEILAGLVSKDGDGALVLDLKSVHLAGDPRMVASQRYLSMNGDSLEYKMSMQTTAASAQHLTASLQRTSIC